MDIGHLDAEAPQRSRGSVAWTDRCEPRAVDRGRPRAVWGSGRFTEAVRMRPRGGTGSQK